jgi:hypothetical protein
MGYFGPPDIQGIQFFLTQQAAFVENVYKKMCMWRKNAFKSARNRVANKLNQSRTEIEY